MSNKIRKDAEASVKKRLILGGFHAKMTIPEGLIPDTHVAYWHKDGNGRLQLAEQAGYTYVTNKAGFKIGDGSTDSNNSIGSKITIVADKTDGTLAYLMMKRKDWHEEDQAIKQHKVDDIDNQIHQKGNVDKGMANSVYGKVDITEGKYKS